MNNLIAKGKERNIDIEIFKTRNKCTDINSMNDTIKLFQISDITRYKIKAIKNGKCIEKFGIEDEYLAAFLFDIDLKTH